MNSATPESAAPENTSGHPQARKKGAGLVVIGVLKLIQATLLLAMSLGVHHMLHRDVRHVVADPARAAELLGFRAGITLEEGMAEFAHAPLRDAVPTARPRV